MGARSQRGPIGRPGGTDVHAEHPRTWAGRRGEAQRAWWAAAGRRVAPGPDNPRVEGGRRAAAWAAVPARARSCARIWSITDVWVMHAMIRMGPRHVGHARGSTSKICCRSAAVGPSPIGGWPRWAPVVARGRWRAALRPVWRSDNAGVLGCTRSDRMAIATPEDAGRQALAGVLIALTVARRNAAGTAEIAGCMDMPDRLGRARLPADFTFRERARVHVHVRVAGA